MHKTPTFARFGIGDCFGGQSYPQFLFIYLFIFGEAESWTQTHNTPLVNS